MSSSPHKRLFQPMIYHIAYQLSWVCYYVYGCCMHVNRNIELTNRLKAKLHNKNLLKSLKRWPFHSFSSCSLPAMTGVRVNCGQYSLNVTFLLKYLLILRVKIC